MADKPVIIEYRYIGNDDFFNTQYDRNWHKWKSYKDEIAAQKSIYNNTHKHKLFEFRMKAKEQKPPCVHCGKIHSRFCKGLPSIYTPPPPLTPAGSEGCNLCNARTMI